MTENLGSIDAWRLRTALPLLFTLLAWESLQPFFIFFTRTPGGWLKRGKHALINLAIGTLNSLMIAFVFASLWFASAQWTAQHHFGILNWADAAAWLRWPLALLLLDVWTYSWHRLNHIFPFLWRFHRLHHSDRNMDVTTASRLHIVEILFSSLLRVPVLALTGCRIEEVAVYELLLFAVVQFHHSNVGLPGRWDRWLRALLVTPYLHKVHHSVVLAECNSNYSSLFSWWDRMFGTIRLVPDPRRIVFGIAETNRFIRTQTLTPAMLSSMGQPDAETAFQQGKCGAIFARAGHLPFEATDCQRGARDGRRIDFPFSGGGHILRQHGR